MDATTMRELLSGSRKARPLNDYLCPSCREEGNPKVCDSQERWHYKCTTPDCNIGYYCPGTTLIEYRLSEADAAAQDARIHEEVTAMLADKVWIHRGNCSRAIPNTDPIPDGWSTTPDPRF